MGTATWRAMIQDKSFTILMYRRGSMWLGFSLLLNLILILFSFYYWSHRGIPEFYATDGIRSPILLQEMSTPNKTSNYLLAPDPVYDEDEGPKKIP